MSKTYIFSVSINRQNAKTYGTIVCYKVLDPDNHALHKDAIAGKYWKQKPMPTLEKGTAIMVPEIQQIPDVGFGCREFNLEYGFNYFFTVNASTQKEAIEAVKVRNRGADSIPYAYRGQSSYNRTRNNKKLPIKWWSYTFG